jgi:ABC-type antimicrobial peptide transport system permease subunit
VAGVLTGCVYLTATATGVAVQFPWWSIAVTAAFTLFVALLSGYLSLKPLYATEPAELLR